MATGLLAGLLIVLSRVTMASGLQCYQCLRESNTDAQKYCELTAPTSPGNNLIVNCSVSQDYCRIVKIILEDETVTYFKRECGKAEDCTNKCSDPDAIDKDVVCDSCCKEDLCNKGEGAQKVPTSGASRIVLIKGLYVIGGFFAWFIFVT